MDWVKGFHTQVSRWYGPSGVVERDRVRASAVERFAGPGKKRILELGAGAGGTAAAMADLGHDVVAIEFNPTDAAWARELAREAREGTLTIVEADFYVADLPGRFDWICYWDGFGVGTDADQRRLLRRVAADWMAPGALVFLDVFSPWKWSRIAGTETRFAARPNAPDPAPLVRRQSFDPVRCRYDDTWARSDGKGTPLTQTLRCYSLADFELLLEGTELTVREVIEADDPVDRDVRHEMEQRFQESGGFWGVLEHAP